jgi:Tfp pilus assembly protein PilX
MSDRRLLSRLAGASSRTAHAQRGVVMFIALLVMVALSLAGIALIRSADTATTVAGNLAFKQSAVYAVDRAVEQTIDKLFTGLPAPAIADKTAHDLAQNYYACVRNAAGTGCIGPTEPIPEIPAALANKAAFETILGSANAAEVETNKDAADNKAYYVIERMCAAAGPAIGPNCNLSSASMGADAGTQHYEGLVRSGDAYYRVTVRVEGPRNTVAYAQAILR